MEDYSEPVVLVDMQQAIHVEVTSDDEATLSTGSYVLAKVYRTTENKFNVTMADSRTRTSLYGQTVSISDLMSALYAARRALLPPDFGAMGSPLP